MVATIKCLHSRVVCKSSHGAIEALRLQAPRESWGSGIKTNKNTMNVILISQSEPCLGHSIFYYNIFFLKLKCLIIEHNIIHSYILYYNTFLVKMI